MFYIYPPQTISGRELAQFFTNIARVHHVWHTDDVTEVVKMAETELNVDSLISRLLEGN